MPAHRSLLLACLADDFTGATDALESLSLAGLRVRMFTGVPAAEETRGLQAIVVASAARSWRGEEMERVRPLLTALRDTGARHVVYKVCSTFDSSPEVGSIGRVVDTGAEVFAQETVPVVAGAPLLGRYCVFGHLFAASGIAEGAEIFRLDRHPTMSRHPVTPMTESDLRVHLGRQTPRTVELVDWRTLEGAAPPEGRPGIRLYEMCSPAHHAPLGAVLARGPVFAVGSSGLTTALGAHWQAAGLVQARGEWPACPAQGPVLVVSGSCSPVTGRQIAAALAAGWAGVDAFAAAAVDEGIAHLRAGRCTILHTSIGPEDARRGAADAALGTRLGEMARAILAATGTRRIIFAGGDTSSHAVAALGIRLLEMLCPVTPGAPLCRAGELEVICKGGQAGPEDFFLRAAR